MGTDISQICRTQQNQRKFRSVIIRCMNHKIWAIVPAGGTGSRMNTVIPKQYLALNGRSVIEYTLGRLCKCDSVSQLVVGIANNDVHWPQLTFENKKPAAVVEAGVERVDTVENCLRFIIQQGGAEDWALVHDAARPCVRAVEIEALIEAVSEHTQGGILAVPLTDTIKRSGKAGMVGRILETVPRDELWRAMTPQLFKAGDLLRAIKNARSRGVPVTDEASAMEAAGVQPLLVPCSPDNIKITLPQDIQFAQMILQAQQEEAK